MRWNPKERVKKGDTRVINKFTWFPMKIGDEWVWLEIVTLKQKADIIHDPTSATSYVEWETIEELPYQPEL